MKTHSVSKFVIIFSTLTALSLGMTGCSTLQYEANSDDIRTVADKIASYTLPDSYHEQFAVELMDYQMVSLTGPVESSHIYLLQAPEGNSFTFEQMEQKILGMQDDRNIDPRQMHVIEIRPAQIRGQDVNLIIQEGLNAQEQVYRSATALFEGRQGLALVSISSHVNLWSLDMVDAFLASLE